MIDNIEQTAGPSRAQRIAERYTGLAGFNPSLEKVKKRLEKKWVR